MKIFKFGGASVHSVERIENLARILKEYDREQLIIIISAMGKTTNALEKVAESFYAGKKEDALMLFDSIKKQHLQTAKYLLVTGYNPCIAQLTDFFTEVEWLLYDKPVREYNYYYDQVVCAGELFSTCLISHYLKEKGIDNQWVDVRDLIRTDDNFREASIDWAYSEKAIKRQLATSDAGITITQGFIGATDENESTTLGREGSDYTAAVFANILDAASVTIWKDVEGVMNADPKIFADARLISELSFDEVIEMAYYGAQVIHPKTIKPLQNKGIPLLVKSFTSPDTEGTTINRKKVRNLPPIIVVKKNQVLVRLKSKDYSFVGETLVAGLYRIFGKLKIKPNLIQTGAIHVEFCMDDLDNRTVELAEAIDDNFDMEAEKGLTLLTIRHYTDTLISEMLSGKDTLLIQQTPDTLQALYR